VRRASSSGRRGIWPDRVRSGKDADVLGAVLWVGFYVGLGYTFRDQLAEAAVLAARLGGWAIAIVAGAFGLYLGVKVTRRQILLRQLCIARISLS